MTTLVVVATDNVTLRVESDDPEAVSWLQAVATEMNDSLKRSFSLIDETTGDRYVSGSHAIKGSGFNPVSR